MIDVSIYLRSKRRPLRFTFETERQKEELLEELEMKKFVNVGCVTILTKEIAYILFENSK